MSEYLLHQTSSTDVGRPLEVEKIGGAGSRDAAAMLENVSRIAGNEALAAVVVSGPGGHAGRVTDLAIDGVNAFQRGEDHSRYFKEGAERLVAHAEPLGKNAVRIAIETAKSMEQGLLDGSGFGWVVMRPELYQAEMYGHLLEESGVHTRLLNPTPWIRRDGYGAIDLATSIGGLAAQLNPNVLTILPGTPGVDSDLRVVPVTPNLRGYTDVAGMVVAEALQQNTNGQPVIYRIIKDGVSGILRMPPGLGRKPGVTPNLSVVEAETLGAAGNKVVHPTVLELLQQSDVRLLVCSGQPGEAAGTIVTRQRAIQEGESVAGIALQDVVAYTVNDIRMEHQQGVVEDIAGTFRVFGVPLIDAVTGRGVVRIYISKAFHDVRQSELQAAFAEKYGDRLTLQGAEADDGLTIVALAGEALATDDVLRVEVMGQAVRTGKNLGIGGIDFWSSPNRNAIYLPIPTKRVNEYAVATYDQFF